MCHVSLHFAPGLALHILALWLDHDLSMQKSTNGRCYSNPKLLDWIYPKSFLPNLKE